MKKNYLYGVMVVILMIVVTTNIIDIVNSIKNAVPMNWTLYTVNYVALTLYFDGASKKKSQE